jgi:hypothetical protein
MFNLMLSIVSGRNCLRTEHLLQAHPTLKMEQKISFTAERMQHNDWFIKICKVEYANSEMNGFSFYSVGSGTVLENLVCLQGADDSLIYGTVEMQKPISYGNTE